MGSNLNQYAGPAIIVGAILFVLWRQKQRAAKPAQPAAPAPVYIQAPAQPMPDLLDLHIDYQDRREREIRRQAQQKRLDQAALEREALVKIGEILTPPNVGEAPKS